MIIRKCWCGLLNWAVREAFLACKENLLLFWCTAPILGTLASHLAASTRAPEMGDHGELLPSLEILFLLFACFSGSWSLSAASAAAAPMSPLQFNLEAGVRWHGLGVAGREGRVRWREAVDAGWNMGIVLPPADWGDSPPRFNSARPFLSATGSEGKEFEFILLPPSHMFWLPCVLLFSPLLLTDATCSACGRGVSAFVGGRRSLP